MGLDIFLQFFVSISQLNKYILLLIHDILSLLFALQFINSKSFRPYFKFYTIHVEGRGFNSQKYFKIYHIPTKYPAIIPTAETIVILC